MKKRKPNQYKSQILDHSLLGLKNEYDYLQMHHYSYAKKKANDFKWVEDMATYIYQDGGVSQEEIAKIKLNADFYNGRGDHAVNHLVDSYANSNIAVEGLEYNLDDIQHHDIISNIAKAMVGEQQKRPLNPVAIDTSTQSSNDRKRKRLELYQEYIQQRIVAPLKDKILQQYMMEHQITDPYQLTPDEQKQMEAEVAQRQQHNTPEEIDDYMRKNYKGASERQAQELINFLMEELDIKFLTDQNFKTMMYAGKQIYRIGVRNHEPFLEVCNPIGFSYQKSPEKFFLS